MSAFHPFLPLRGKKRTCGTLRPRSAQVTRGPVVACAVIRFAPWARPGEASTWGEFSSNEYRSVEYERCCNQGS